MTHAELWNDHTFRTLLDDVFKARKDPEMGPLRLKVAMDYVAAKGIVEAPAHVRNDLQRVIPKPKPQVPVVPIATVLTPEPISMEESQEESSLNASGFTLTEEEEQAELEEAEPQPRKKAVAESSIGYVDRMRAQRKNPNIELNKVADVVIAAMNKGAWDANGQMQVQVPKGVSILGLQPLLRERGAVFTAFSASMAMSKQTMDAKFWTMSKEQAERAPAGQGHRVVGWVINIIK